MCYCVIYVLLFTHTSSSSGASGCSALLVQYEALGAAQNLIGFLLLAISCSILFIAVPSVLDEVTSCRTAGMRKRTLHMHITVHDITVRVDRITESVYSYEINCESIPNQLLEVTALVVKNIINNC